MLRSEGGGPKVVDLPFFLFFVDVMSFFLDFVDVMPFFLDFIDVMRRVWV